MHGFGEYYWLVVRRAWRDSLTMVIPRKPLDIVRDAFLLVITIALFWWLKPILVHMEYTTEDNLRDTIAWTLLGGVCVVGVFAFVFLINALFVAPYRLWKEERARHPQPGKLLQSQPTFPLWQAACYLAGVEPHRNPTGEASGYLHQLKGHVAEMKLGRNARRFQLPHDVFASAVDRTSDSYEISRAALKSFAQSRGITIEGITDK